MKDQLLLVDGTSYFYRAFFAVKTLTTRAGFPTNAIFGFTNILNKVLKQFNPKFLVMVFDTPARTFRHEMFESYKSSRVEMPEALAVQIPYIRKIVRAYRIASMEVDGFEADDVMATLSTKAEASGWETLIISGDKDLLQCVTRRTRVYDPSEDRIMNIEDVEKKHGIPPEHFTDYQGLAGDPVDDIPGVPGIGPKTAVKLVRQFGCLDNLYKNLDTLPANSMKQKLEQFRSQAFLSRDLARFRRDAPVHWRPDDWKRQEPDAHELQHLFAELEFHTFLKGAARATPESRVNIISLKSRKELESLTSDLAGAGQFSIFPQATSPESMKADFSSLALAIENRSAYYLLWTPSDSLLPHSAESRDMICGLKPYLQDSSKLKICFDSKILRVLLGKYSITLSDPVSDLSIAGQLLHPEISKIDVAHLAGLYLNQTMESPVKADSLPGDEARRTGGQAAVTLLALDPVIRNKLEGEQLSHLYQDLELPLIKVIADIETCGVRIDVVFLSRLSQDFEVQLNRLKKEIYNEAACEFNIDSPKQLQDVLYHRLKLKPGRRTKTGYSTDVGELERLAAHHPLPEKLLGYRSLSKLKNTYVDALPELVHPETGRIHTTYHQDGAATGRLSSSNPNLQNIPIRTPEGMQIRRAFIPDSGCLLIAADYSQVELRLLAHLSEDPLLIRAFLESRDIHQETASEVFDVPYDHVTDDMRRKAKVINFGIVYGISAHGLSQQLSIDRSQAQTYIDQMFQKFPGIRRYMDATLSHVRDHGFVKTLLGRRRWIPDIRSNNPSIRSAAERVAINTPIQGSSADLIKMAMVRLHRAFHETSLKARMIMQVHDELVIEAPEHESDRVRSMLKECMEQVYPLRVPLRVDLSMGKTWGDMS